VGDRRPQHVITVIHRMRYTWTRTQDTPWR